MQRARVQAHLRSTVLGENFDLNDEKMMFPDFVQNHSRKVPEAREHVFKSISPSRDHQKH